MSKCQLFIIKLKFDVIFIRVTKRGCGEGKVIRAVAAMFSTARLIITKNLLYSRCLLGNTYVSVCLALKIVCR